MEAISSSASSKNFSFLEHLSAEELVAKSFYSCTSSQLENKLFLSSLSDVARVSGDELLGDAFCEAGALPNKLPF